MKFEPSDFCTKTVSTLNDGSKYVQEHGMLLISWSQAAEFANKRLAEMLADAPIVYSRPNFGNNCEVWARAWENGVEDVSRTARLVDIKKIGEGE